jgi:hypothetical protein
MDRLNLEFIKTGFYFVRIKMGIHKPLFFGRRLPFLHFVLLTVWMLPLLHFLPKPIRIYMDEMKGTLSICLPESRFNFHGESVKRTMKVGERNLKDAIMLP